MKKLLIALLIVMLAVVYPLSGCQSKQIYRSDNVTAVQVNPLSKKVFASCEWLPLSEEDAYENNPVIVTGTVKNVREVEINFTYHEKELTEYITLFDFEVAEFLHNSSSTISSDSRLLTMGYAVSSRCFPEGVPVVENGKELLLFCQVPGEQMSEDPQNKKAYVDCWVYDPYRLMLEKVGEQYILNRFWGEEVNIGQKLSALNEIDDSIYAALRERTDSDSSDYSVLFQSEYCIDCDNIEKLIKETALQHLQEVS